MRDVVRLLALVLMLLVARGAAAAHAYAQFGDVKYPEGFTHFGYVNPDAPKGGEIRMVPPTRPTNFDTFNPFTLKGTPPYGLSSLLFDTLLTGNMDEPTTAYGLLAQDISVAPDRLSVTFRLHPQARFHDGKPVLAADVVHSFKTLISKQAAPQYRSAYRDVKDAVVLDPLTVRFDFAVPSAELPLMVGGMPVFSREWGQGKPFDQVVSDIPIGSGPYRIANPRMGRDITYARDPKYWAAQLPVRRGHFNFDRISFKIYLDDTSRFEGLKANEFDFMREFTSRNWARQYKGRVFESGELRQRAFENRNPGDFQGYVLNVRRPQFRDVRVREALGLAFDFEWLNRQLFYGVYKRAQGYFPNSDFQAEGAPEGDELALLETLRSRLRPEVFGPVPLASSTAPPGSLRENLRRAQALLAQAGWNYRDGALRNEKGEAFTLEFMIDQPGLVRTAVPFQKALEKLGIRLTFRTVDYSLAKQRLDNFDFDITSLRLLGSTSPGGELLDRFGSQAAATPGAINLWGIADPAVDALLQKVVQATTRPQLVTALRALDRVLRQGHYSIPQYYGSDHLVGYRPRPFVLPPVLPSYYEAHTWAMSTWWASPANR